MLPRFVAGTIKCTVTCDITGRGHQGACARFLLDFAHASFPSADFHGHPLAVMSRNQEHKSFSESCESVQGITEPEGGLGDHPHTETHLTP